MSEFSNRPDPSDNRRTILALHDGDEATFEAVYRHYFRSLVAYASRWLPFEEARSVVQDTMMWLWEGRRTLMPDMSLKSLLFVITKNKAINQAVRTGVRSRIREDFRHRFEERFEEPDFYLKNNLRDHFDRALARMPEEYRRALEMNRMQGLTHREIAEVLGVSPQTVNYRICQALKLLRSELREYLPLAMMLWISSGSKLF